jgi:hypothetical protein
LKQRYTRCHRALVAALAEIREAAGLTQSEVSRRLKRPRNFSHVVEGGERSLSVCEFIEYVEAIGGDPAQVIRRIAGT